MIDGVLNRSQKLINLFGDMIETLVLNQLNSLQEKCPYSEFFLVRVFPHLD